MDPGADEQPDRAELASRVEQLEQTVSKMLPDRRGVIKGLGAAAIGGAAVGASSGGASGQSAAGQVGTSSEPVDTFAFDLDVQGALQRDLDAGGQAITNVGSVSTGEVSRNIGHEPDYFIYGDSSGTVNAVTQTGSKVHESSRSNDLLSVLEAVISRVKSQTDEYGAHVYIAPNSGQQYYTVQDGDEITGVDWGDFMTIEFAPTAKVAVSQSITGTVGENNRSPLIDVRRVGGQTAWVKFIGHGTQIDCNGNVDVPFYFGDTRQSCVKGFEFQSPTVSPYHFGNEESGNTAQFNGAVDYSVSDPDGVMPDRGGSFRGNTDITAAGLTRPLRVAAVTGLYVDGCPKTDIRNVFQSDLGATGEIGVLVETDAGDTTGRVNNIYTEAAAPQALVRLNATANTINKFGTRNVWNVLNAQGENLIEVAENGGGVGYTSHHVKMPSRGPSDSGNLLAITAGDPFFTDLEAEYSFNDAGGGLLDVVDKGPNNSTVRANGTAWGSGSPGGNNYPAGTFYRDTGTNDIYYIDDREAGNLI